MLKELKDLNETYKLKMFRGLAWTLGTFVTLFTTLTVAMLAAEGSQTQSWEWKFEWINVVSWEVWYRTARHLAVDLQRFFRAVPARSSVISTPYQSTRATCAAACIFVSVHVSGGLRRQHLVHV